MNFLSIFALVLLIAAVSGESPTAYELLQDYNFPVGILPKGVTHYDLNNSTGQFHAYLNGTCSFSLEGSYQLKYRSTIGGTISKNKIRDLSGVSVKVLFVWLNIVEVVRDGDELSLSVGIASASFPVDNFEECPQCGCGLKCGGQKIQKIRLRRGGELVSSV
uniref:Uncharacterized protein n=1 Tax=Kalanchoe fedtschenkoi TaxID=63787 RepID=A0A7N0ZWA8_KALFE